MAFWGVEVKPGRPFTHPPDAGRGRLHISQATLGRGSATKNSLVQCNVGSKSPVLLCSLFPEKSETCQLHLEFNEVDEVIFSVIGPRSVHLTGYYLGGGGGGRYNNIDDESESFGEDIADTETDRSAEDDEYNCSDSFIDDDDLEIVTTSPVSSGGVEEALNKGKPNCGKCSRRRLTKKSQVIESDDDIVLHEQETFANGNAVTRVSDSEFEDISLISSPLRSKPTAKRGLLQSENDNKGVVNRSSETENQPSVGKSKRIPGQSSSILPSAELISKVCDKPKKKREVQSKEKKQVETGTEDDFFSGNILKWDKTMENDTHSKPLDQTTSALNELIQKTADDEVSKEDKSQRNQDKQANIGQDTQIKKDESQTQPYDGTSNLLLSPKTVSIQVGLENCAKPRRKRKERAEEKAIELDGGSHSNILKEEKAKQDEMKSEMMDKDFSVQDDQNRKQITNLFFDNNADQSADVNHSERKTKKKKKIKNRIQENLEDSNVEVSAMSVNEIKRSVVDMKDNNTDKMSSQSTVTMSNGLIVMELETGKPDGKIAAPGKKISIRYTGRLKNCGQVFDSNIDGEPKKFKLGEENVLGGWNVGLEGMRVGERRRLIVPPSLGYGSVGDDDKNVPPNSWLEYEVELLKVR